MDSATLHSEDHRNETWPLRVGSVRKERAIGDVRLRCRLLSEPTLRRRSG